MKNASYNKWHSLIEMITVIVIISLLMIVAFGNYSLIIVSLENLYTLYWSKHIQQRLEIFFIRASTYPKTQNMHSISVGSMQNVAYQGYMDHELASLLGILTPPKDKVTKNFFWYAINGNKIKYSIFFHLQKDSLFSFWNNRQVIPYTHTNGMCFLLDESYTVPKYPIELLYAQWDRTFIFLPHKEIQVKGKGKYLWWAYEMFIHKWWNVEAPSVCKEWFIPVPWNYHFLQPWFCVAQYEASLEKELTSSELNESYDRNSWKWTLSSKSHTGTWEDGKIVFTQGNFPIANITQWKALKACASIDAHLITNTEWMTIARHIELTPENWNTKSIGTWYLFHGLTNSSNKWCGSGSNTYFHVLYKYGAKTWENEPNSETSWLKADTCNKRRKHLLPWGYSIWDMGGNVAEHVNGANTRNGEWYNRMSPHVCGTWGASSYNWYSFFFDPGKDSSPQCSFADDYPQALYSPFHSYVNGFHGMWKIRSQKEKSYTGSFILIRWGYHSLTNEAGIYSMIATREETFSHYNVGFRCAY